MNTEQFLRKYFGLKGPFYTEEYQKVLDNWSDDAYEKWCKAHPDDELRPMYTGEAWHLWDKALRMSDDLAAEGYDFRGTLAQFLCDNA